MDDLQHPGCLIVVDAVVDQQVAATLQAFISDYGGRVSYLLSEVPFSRDQTELLPSDADSDGNS